MYIYIYVCIYIVAYRIITQHNGNLSVYSPGEGLGCTFTMELPICPKTNNILCNNTTDNINISSNIINIDANINSPADVMDFNVSTNLYQKENVIEVINIIKKILIVDDAVMNRKMLRRLLDGRIDTIIEADDGNIAVNLIKDNMNNNEIPFDVILMDFVMPNMNGPDATYEIRKLGYTGLIIGVTGNTILCDIEHFKLSGANDVLAKPLNMEKLEHMMQSNIIIYIYIYI